LVTRILSVTSFFEELKRRNVIKVAIAYIVVGWLVSQVAEFATENFGAPDWVLKIFVVFVLLGLPMVLVFAWAFELTPEGLKREKDVDRSQSITHRTGRKLDYTIIAVMAIALTYFIWESRFQKGSEPFSDTEALQTSQTSGPEHLEGAPTPMKDNSIAVLPFADMSPDKDQEYFTDGLSEELLNLLAKIPELNVAARTSSFQFKDKGGDIADIGRQLKVAHLLEGSVRKSGDRVRITAQLIKAEDGYHLWSETWDRTLDDVFAIQDEISAAVVDALKITLLGEAPHVAETNPEAYALYLRGKFLLNQRTEDAWKKAEEAFQKAIDIDPGYAAAWAGLSWAQSSRAGFGHIPLDAGMESARQSAERALELNPGLAAGWSNLAIIHSNYDWDYAASEKAIQKALQLEPNNAMVLRQAGNQAKFTGKLDEAIALYKKALELDPINSFLHGDLVGALTSANRLDEAEVYARDLLNLNDQVSAAHANLSDILLVQGHLEQALIEAQLETDEIWRTFQLVLIHHVSGNHAESDALLAKFVEQNPVAWAYQAGDLHAFRGEIDAAFEWLDRAVKQRDPGFAWVLTDTLLRNLHDDPRWEPLMEQVGLLDAWRAMSDEFKGHPQ
jgi:TolB-like protein/Tfp pilus assembly protein PilF